MYQVSAKAEAVKARNASVIVVMRSIVSSSIDGVSYLSLGIYFGDYKTG